MKTLEDIIPNSKLRNEVYKLMLLNSQNCVIINKVAAFTDEIYYENCGVYCGDGKKLIKYEEGDFITVNVNLPDNWDRIVCYHNKKRLMD